MMSGLRWQGTIQMGGRPGDNERLAYWTRLTKRLGNVEALRHLIDLAISLTKNKTEEK